MNIDEFKKDKKELEDKIKTLLQNFNAKYVDTVIQNVDIVHIFSRNSIGEVIENRIESVMIKTYM